MSEQNNKQRARLSMDVGIALPYLVHDGWRASLRDGLNSLLGMHQAHDIFQEAYAKQPSNVFLGVIEVMEMTTAQNDLETSIPSSGAAIIVANHPFGGADAIALCGLCIAQRPDTKVFANAITAELPGTAEFSIFLQILGEKGATQTNRFAMKEALAHLRAGGVLVVFPAGGVSRWRNDLTQVADPEWSEHVARLAQKTATPVLPVKIFGRNPTWFELLGAIHRIVRSALIVRVFLASRSHEIRLKAGKIIEPQQLREADDAAEVTKMLREAVESIREP